MASQNSGKVIDAIWTYDGAWKVYFPDPNIDRSTALSIPRITTIKATDGVWVR